MALSTPNHVRASCKQRSGRRCAAILGSPGAILGPSWVHLVALGPSAAPSKKLKNHWFLLVFRGRGAPGGAQNGPRWARMRQDGPRMPPGGPHGPGGGRNYVKFHAGTPQNGPGGRKQSMPSKLYSFLRGFWGSPKVCPEGPDGLVNSDPRSGNDLAAAAPPPAAPGAAPIKRLGIYIYWFCGV